MVHRTSDVIGNLAHGGTVGIGGVEDTAPA
jgi:hypothetical protein